MRVAKTDLGIISELQDQLIILEEHLARIKGGDARSVKIVAPILHDLVCSYNSNPKPLLLRIANMYSVELIVKLDVPPVFKDTMPLQEYLDSLAFASGTEGIQMTNLELIKTVSDTGEGIEAQDKDKMFAPFSRATDTQQLNYEGLGLSLYTDKIITDKYNGTIAVSENPGGGTIVSVALQSKIEQ